MPVNDFVTAHYLGIGHNCRELPYFPQLSTGTPAAIRESPVAGQVAHEVAKMQGREAGIISASTLHLFWDMMGQWLPDRVTLFVDREVYQVAQWGVERAKGCGVSLKYFGHLSPESLAGTLCESAGKIPVVVVDGWCPICGKESPLKDYAAIIKPYDGWLIVDDTQSFGILGAFPGKKSG